MLLLARSGAGPAGLRRLLTAAGWRGQGSWPSLTAKKSRQFRIRGAVKRSFPRQQLMPLGNLARHLEDLLQQGKAREVMCGGTHPLITLNPGLFTEPWSS